LYQLAFHKGFLTGRAELPNTNNEKGETRMKQANKLFTVAVLLLMSISVTLAQNRAKQSKNQAQPQATSNPVTGSGTIGRLSKWTSPMTLGDSVVFEDKFGKIGIGTITPTSPLTIQGMVETTLGGYKFPDGTVQTTAALATVFHDASLTGTGTAASPLGIAPGGVGTSQLANNAVTALKIASGQVVKSFNGLFDNVTLQAGSNITITPSGNTLTIAAPGGAIAHDATLAGSGTAAMPLSVAIPLKLTGDVNGDNAIITATNRGESGVGITAEGGGAINADGGHGVKAIGGISQDNTGGNGVDAKGGAGISFGGNGVYAEGGNSSQGAGGAGLTARGGIARSAGKRSGPGIEAYGGIGEQGAANGLAGIFHGSVTTFTLQGESGNLTVNGNLKVSGLVSKGGGSFKIDHPLDPENKYLYHSFVESPDMMNIYNGNITTDGNGEAVIEMPAYFEALNRDFRYQLTVIGTFAQAIVADEMKGNHFSIRTNAPNVKVSWQVTGVRQDAFANKNRIPVEEDKSEGERGYYLHPEAFSQPETKSVLMVRHPERMRQRKEARENARKEKLQ
jgi:trimeric autotransporter adhesin